MRRVTVPRTGTSIVVSKLTVGQGTSIVTPRTVIVTIPFCTGNVTLANTVIGSGRTVPPIAVIWTVTEHNVGIAMHNFSFSIFLILHVTYSMYFL
jgi:hypothetical protein